MSDSFSCRRHLDVQGKSFAYHSLPALSEHPDLPGDVSRLPYSLKILLENLLRHEDGVDVTRADIEALVAWSPTAEPATEIAFTPSRVVLQDFTGVPAIVDLAAMRDAMQALGGRPGADQSSVAGGTGHRPLRAGGQVRFPRRPRPEQRHRIQAQPGTLQPFSSGARAPSATSPWCRPTQASSTR